MFENSEIGLQFDQYGWSPFLYFGIALAFLHTLGKMPDLKDKFIMNESGTEIYFSNCFKRRVGTLIGPTVLLFAVLPMISCISPSLNRSRKKEIRFYFLNP